MSARRIAMWTPSVKVAPKDHIVSSAYSNSLPFIPDYEKEPIDMQTIMSHGYAKKWYKEKGAFSKKLHDMKTENEKFIKVRDACVLTGSLVGQSTVVDWYNLCRDVCERPLSAERIYLLDDYHFIERKVFLMRRYVIKGLNKKLEDLAQIGKQPSRVKLCKKVPYAVRLRPPDECIPSNEKSAISSKEIEKESDALQIKQKTPVKDNEVRDETAEVSKEVENSQPVDNLCSEHDYARCTQNRSAKLQGTIIQGISGADQLKQDVQSLSPHMHALQSGNKLELFRVDCSERHHHECDCTEF